MKRTSPPQKDDKHSPPREKKWVCDEVEKSSPSKDEHGDHYIPKKQEWIYDEDGNAIRGKYTWRERNPNAPRTIWKLAFEGTPRRRVARRVVVYLAHAEAEEEEEEHGEVMHYPGAHVAKPVRRRLTYEELDDDNI